MTLGDAITDTRRYLKDFTQNVWKDADIVSFLNTAIMSIKITVPKYFANLTRVVNTVDTINIDDEYYDLIPLFASSRCFSQDEQHYRAVQNMNEFESRKADMELRITNSDEYAAIIADDESEYVTNVYSDTESDL